MKKLLVSMVAILSMGLVTFAQNNSEWTEQDILVEMAKHQGSAFSYRTQAVWSDYARLWIMEENTEAVMNFVNVALSFWNVSVKETVKIISETKFVDERTIANTNEEYVTALQLAENENKTVMANYLQDVVKELIEKSTLFNSFRSIEEFEEYKVANKEVLEKDSIQRNLFNRYLKRQFKGKSPQERR